MKKILIIDGDPDVALYLKIFLEDHDCIVLTAHDGDTGFKIAKEEPPDLICLDIMMPKKSGVTLYKKLKQDKKLRDIPVVVISGLESAYSLQGPKFRRLIPDPKTPEPIAFLEKPIDVFDLVGFLPKTVDSPRME
jgi:CheY-like chemotaxis protein